MSVGLFKKQSGSVMMCGKQNDRPFYSRVDPWLVMMRMLLERRVSILLLIKGPQLHGRQPERRGMQ